MIVDGSIIDRSGRRQPRRQSHSSRGLPFNQIPPPLAYIMCNEYMHLPHAVIAGWPASLPTLIGSERQQHTDHIRMTRLPCLVGRCGAILRLASKHRHMTYTAPSTP
jgi:hypothetical protein